MFRLIVYLYCVLAVSLLLISFFTTRSAKQLTGEDYYLFTRTHVFVDRYVAPRNATDAALDEAEGDDDGEQDSASEGGSGKSCCAGTMTVDQPLFVLGFLDVTGSFIIFGGFALLIAAGVRMALRKRRKWASQGP